MTQLQEMQWVEQVGEQVKHPEPNNPTKPTRLNLFRLPWLRTAIESRWPQFLARSLTLAGFVFTIATALFGTGVGSHNFAIIVIWIAWWTTLKLGFIPFGGRSWCSICPIPLLGDWLQQGGILVKDGKKHGLNLRWPRSMRLSWLQSAGFLLIGLFSAVTLTEPRVTGWVLLASAALATSMSLVFENRAFCSYLCPIGGFSGLYAKTAPVELRVVDKTVCINHEDKSCYLACPWGLYPLAFRDSSACGLCMECLRACPKDNLALNLRPYGSDLIGSQTSSRLDEPLLALVMLGSALVFSAVYIGPWGSLKLAAYEIGSQAWMVYGAGFLAISLLILPALFTLSVWLWKKISQINISLKQLVAGYSQGLLPLGLLAWIAFTISFALPKLNLVLGVINDPFGWGWHWLTAANISRSLDVSSFSPHLQVFLLLLGAFWSAAVIQKLSRQRSDRNLPPNIPVMGFSLLYTGTMLWLLLG